MNFPKLTRLPVARVPLRDLGFWKHLKTCKDGLCRIVLLHVELPLTLRWVGVVAAGFFLARGMWLNATFSALAFVLLTIHGNWMGRFISFVAAVVAKEEVREQLANVLGKTIEKMGMGPVEEDPVDRIIRESNELARRKARDGSGGEPPVS